MRQIAKLRLTNILALLVISALSSVLINTQSALAVSGGEWKPGRIIDDTIFFNKSSMTVGQIQDFLNAKVPVCDRNRPSSNPSYQPPYTCLKEYQENPTTGESNYGRFNPDGSPLQISGGKSAAQIIWEEAQNYGINPQSLIVMLQKEQSLVTDDWPWLIQYQKAMGQSCPDTAPCDPAFAGFYNQVSGAAWQLRHYVNNPDWFLYRAGTNRLIQWNPSTSCGNSNVYIENIATAALYNYTPYQPNQAALNNLYGTGDSCSSYGNRNFWRLFNDWFGTTIVGSQPSPVYKGESGTQLFAVWGTKKYYIPSYDAMIAWGLHNKPVSIVPDGYLDQLEAGDWLSTIGKMSDDPSSPLFLFDDGKRYQIPINACAKNLDGTPRANTSWGLDCFNASISKSYPQDFLKRYTTQDITLPEMIAFKDSVWKMEQGKKRRIIDSFVIDVLGGWGKVRWMKDANAKQPEGRLIMRNGFSVRFSGSSLVYRYDNDSLHAVSSFDTFLAWGFHKQSLRDVPSSYNAAEPLPVSEPVTQVAIDQATDSYYLVDKGYRMYLGTSENSQWPTASAGSVKMDESLKMLPQIPLSSIYLAEGGSIFTVHGGKKYVYPTMDDFFSLGANPALIRVMSKSVETLPGLTFGGYHLANGRLYKVNNNPHQIYRVNSTTSQYVNSTNYPGLPYDKLITIDPITAARYPVNGTYTP